MTSYRRALVFADSLWHYRTLNHLPADWRMPKFGWVVLAGLVIAGYMGNWLMFRLASDEFVCCGYLYMAHTWYTMHVYMTVFLNYQTARWIMLMFAHTYNLYTRPYIQSVVYTMCICTTRNVHPSSWPLLRHMSVRNAIFVYHCVAQEK